jgi:LysM repeat protein
VAVAFALAAGVIVLALVGHWLGGGPLTAPEPRPATAVPVVASVYIVQPGDTLWTLARRSQPTGDLRPLVDRLAAAQRHQPLRAGQRIVLP